jgi:hypothetical protein
MTIKTMVSFALIYLLIFSSCTQNPAFSISEDLKNGLHDEYSTYVNYLNRAVSGDTIALINLFNINVADGACYGHGSILYKLLVKIGDEKFYRGVLKLKKDQYNNMQTYFYCGLDVDGNLCEKWWEKYPLTFNYLKIKVGENGK